MNSHPQSPAPSPSQVLVVGIGNEFRRDDGAGVAVARALRAAEQAGIEVSEHSGEGTGMMAMWNGRPLVYVVDAVTSGARVGTVYRFDVVGGELDRATLVFRGTSHQIGLGEAIELGRVLGQLPAKLVIFGIEGDAFGDGVGLTSAVERASLEVVDRILVECSDYRLSGDPTLDTRPQTP